MKRGPAGLLALAALVAGTASAPFPVDVPRRMPARRLYPRPTKSLGKKNRGRETDRRRRQIAKGTIRTTCGRAQQCRCAGCRRARKRRRS